MQQRRVRLGDILDDYCPRERRVTNHAVVAMIEDDVKQTRCATCDTEHEYKHAKVPASRRKKPTPVALGAPVEPSELEPSLVAEVEADVEGEIAVSPPEPIEVANEPELSQEDAEPVSEAEHEWVHRPLIRATLPRPEGQTPERKPTDFTLRQTSGRYDSQGNGNRPRGDRHGRHAHGQSSGQGQSRFGNSRSGSGHGSRHGGGQQAGGPPRQGNRQGQPSSGQRSRTGHGGQRPGQGRGPKRGR